ncbi:cobalamin-binding protein, partial [candidate division KSB1 bacterium]|nr:cobalamin-binding protein [candidate division KSB1 bacterium]
MVAEVQQKEIFGLVRPETDAHTLGITAVAKLIEGCGYKVIIGDAEISHAIAHIKKITNISFLCNWIDSNKITRLGFSYRLDPADAQQGFGRLYHLLKQHNQFAQQGGTLLQIYFAALPSACKRIQSEYHNQIPVFAGDETPIESLRKLGIPNIAIPASITAGSKYDDERMSFAQDLINQGEYQSISSRGRFDYANYGTRKDTLAERIARNCVPGFPPLMRAHAGPYNPDYKEAKQEFITWLKVLAETKFLDIISIGSSQLSQSDFGQDWGDRPNGGGVPINSEQDLSDIYDASRPMLVRTYAGTRDIPYLADVYERTINIAWHALSFWWFNKIDGRGPYSVWQNLEQHIEALKLISKTEKPFEPNIPHHFAFRGADDYSYVLSAYLAAKTAKNLGIRYLVLQIMMNTPKHIWGVQDLARARALLKLVRELEDNKFRVFLQPRAGLDYFSPDLEKAKVQLAAVTAMMDDVEPDNGFSPNIIHVVSYCEAAKLATPDYINESIRITIKSIFEYRRQKKTALVDDMKNNFEVTERTNDLYQKVKSIVALIEKNIPAV